MQKLANAAWHAEASQIYQNYDLWPLAGGQEQPVFLASGAVKPRSSLLVEFLRRDANLPERGTLLDIGCGTGAAIRSFGMEFPGWKLNGADLTAKALPHLRQIPGFDRLYAGDLTAIENTFDLVSMIHSLEHFPDPCDGLKSARGCLGQRGRLLVEVPNAAANPFDLLIADHLSHFTPVHLQLLARRAGLQVVSLQDGLLPKEITMLATKSAGAGENATPIDAARWASFASAATRWLLNVVSDARARALKAKSEGRLFGIFGTSISGMWLFGALAPLVDFFVDEDAARQGRAWEGLPVLSPVNVARSATVYVPLVPEIADRVSRRLGSVTGLYIATPILVNTPSI